MPLGAVATSETRWQCHALAKAEWSDKLSKWSSRLGLLRMTDLFLAATLGLRNGRLKNRLKRCGKGTSSWRSPSTAKRQITEPQVLTRFVECAHERMKHLGRFRVLLRAGLP